jgi:hypothetical protein
MSAVSSSCGKQNARRSSRHKAKYASLRLKNEKKKNRRVLKSSHGKFKTVAELVTAQQKAESEKGYRPQRKREAA